jgi:hypothetical protein
MRGFVRNGLPSSSSRGGLSGFAEVGLHAVASLYVKTPRIAEGHVFFECRLMQVIELEKCGHSSWMRCCQSARSMQGSPIPSLRRGLPIWVLQRSLFRLLTSATSSPKTPRSRPRCSSSRTSSWSERNRRSINAVWRMNRPCRLGVNSGRLAGGRA